MAWHFNVSVLSPKQVVAGPLSHVAQRNRVQAVYEVAARKRAPDANATDDATGEAECSEAGLAVCSDAVRLLRCRRSCGQCTGTDSFRSRPYEPAPFYASREEARNASRDKRGVE